MPLAREQPQRPESRASEIQGYSASRPRPDSDSEIEGSVGTSSLELSKLNLRLRIDFKFKLPVTCHWQPECQSLSGSRS